MRIASALLLCLLGVFVNAQTTTPADEQSDEKKDETTLVKRGDVSAVIDIEGFFEPTESYEVRVRPKSYQGDLLVASSVAAGAVVKKGDKLLDIDSTQIRKQLSAAENDLATAQANLTKAQSDVQLGEAGDALAMKMQQTELSNAEEGLKWWEQVDGAQMLKSAELAVKSAKDRVEDEGDELEQLKKMYKSEELTSATADIVVKRAIRSLERAKIMQGMQEERETKTKAFDYGVARQKLVFAIEQQRQQLAELVAKQAQQSAIRKTALVSAQSSTDRAQQKVDELKGDFDAFDIEAPFDGTVFAGEFVQGRWKDANPKLLRADEKLPGGQIVMTLVPAGKLRLVLEVPEAKLVWIKPDLKIRVIPTGLLDAATEGTCGAAPAAGVWREREHFFLTPVTMENVDPQLHPGQRATGRIRVEVNDALVVPVSAVSKDRVKIRGPDGQPQWRDVVTGASDGEVIEIRSGLKEGDEIFTRASK